MEVQPAERGLCGGVAVVVDGEDAGPGDAASAEELIEPGCDAFTSESAAIYGLRSEAPVAECLRHGRKLWARMMWNKFKVEITIVLYTLLLFVPGLIAMAKLALTDAIVAVDGAAEPEPLARSIELTAGRRWRVFFVVAPLAILDLAGSFYLLGKPPGAAHSQWMLAAVDSAWAVVGMWMTVAGLMLYLGVAPKRVTVDSRCSSRGRNRASRGASRGA